MDPCIEAFRPHELIEVAAVKVHKACRVFDGAAPHFLIGQFKEQNAVVILFHEQTEIVVLSFQLGVFVREQFLLHEAVDFLGDEHV